MAASFGEIIKRTMPKGADIFTTETKELFMKVIKGSLGDIDEIRIKMLPHIAKFIELLPKREEKTEFLNEIALK
jgi:hypothetical protein